MAFDPSTISRDFLGYHRVMEGRRSREIAVIFDGDDTLWQTEHLYDDARTSARHIVEVAGCNGELWETVQRRLDLSNVAVFGFSTERFPTSCVQAYEEVCKSAGMRPDPKTVQAVRGAAKRVFEVDPPLTEDVDWVLTQLRQAGVRLALLTKGDFALQQKRVERSGLSAAFDIIRIVVDKNPEVLRELVNELKVSPSATWMVGNSVRSDILPALAAGLNAVWIDAHVWEHERAHDHLADDRVVVASALPDLLKILHIEAIPGAPAVSLTRKPQDLQ